MKKIVLLVNGTRVRFSDLITGMNHPKTGDLATLRRVAEIAQEVDPQITGFEIVDEAEEPSPRSLGAGRPVK